MKLSLLLIPLIVVIVYATISSAQVKTTKRPSAALAKRPFTKTNRPVSKVIKASKSPFKRLQTRTLKPADKKFVKGTNVSKSPRKANPSRRPRRKLNKLALKAAPGSKVFPDAKQWLTDFQQRFKNVQQTLRSSAVDSEFVKQIKKGSQLAIKSISKVINDRTKAIEAGNLLAASYLKNMETLLNRLGRRVLPLNWQQSMCGIGRATTTCGSKSA